MDNLPENPSDHTNIVSLFPIPQKNRSSEAFEEVPLPDIPLPGRHYEQKARKRQEVFLQKRRATKKRRVFYNRLKILLRLVFCVVLTVGVYAASRLPIWYVAPSQVSIQGNQLLTPWQLQPLLAPVIRQPIYLINPLKIEQTLKQQVSLVDHVYVRRHLFPTGLTVAITEKPVWGVVYQKLPPTQPISLLHWDGTLTDLTSFSLSSDALTRVGHPPVLISSGQLPNNPALLSQYRDITAFLNSNPQLAKLQYVDVSDPQDLKAAFDGFLVRIGQPNKTMMTRLSRLFKIMPEIRNYQQTIQWVDLRWDQQIIFKRKPKI